MFRRSAILVATLALSGCGIQVHPSPEAVVARLVADPVPAHTALALPPVNIESLALGLGQTVVSLTFDDGKASNAAAAEILNRHGLHGTFFLNSGHINWDGWLTMAQVDQIALAGHEIAGHTMTHPDTSVLTADELTRQICDDRAQWLAWGFPVRNFAYPFGDADQGLEDIVAHCGYNSARSLGELHSVHLPSNAIPGASCESCDVIELVPPTVPMYTKAPTQVRSDWTLADFQEQVNLAVARQNGWLELTFHGVCPSDCNPLNVSADEFEQFVTWLADQQAQGRLTVHTVGEVIGGPVQPAVPGPPPTPAVINSSLEDTQDGVPSCWTRAAFGNNKTEFSLAPGHTGAVAEKIAMRDHVDGDAKLVPTEDLGTCSIQVVPESSPTISAWYTSTAPTRFSVQYRVERGRWIQGVISPKFNPATDWTQATWTLPQLPPGVTAVSFGLTLSDNGELVTDDYALVQGVAP